MSAMPLHLPTDRLHVPVERLHLDKLPTDKLPFPGRRKPARRRSTTALLVGVPLLGLLAALVAYWRRTRDMTPQEYLEADVSAQSPDSLSPVGMSRSAQGQHRTA